MDRNSIPILDISTFDTAEGRRSLSEKISAACREHGFFYIAGHGISESLQRNLLALSRQFFALPLAEKLEIEMAKGRQAWRGFFPVNGELTSGRPDLKEGIYFGSELDESHPAVKAGLPLHGPNLFPARPEGFKDSVLEYITRVSGLGHKILRGVALSLELDEAYFEAHYTHDPLVLFRIFHYPPQQFPSTQWGVGEHTDYGLLTILLQDDTGGLQVKSHGAWIDAPPIPDTFICNIGDMLDRMTGGLYRSIPHRVLNTSGKSRYSFPLFFDPGFSANIRRVEGLPAPADDRTSRWDKASVHDFSGTYGDYLLRKIGKVFPDLSKDALITPLT